MLCNSCGKEINDGAVICVDCGCATSNPVPDASYQPMAGFFLSCLMPIVLLIGLLASSIELIVIGIVLNVVLFFLPLIGFFVSLVQLIKAIKNRGLWVFPVLGLLISTAVLLLYTSLALFVLEILAII